MEESKKEKETNGVKIFEYDTYKVKKFEHETLKPKIFEYETYKIKKFGE